MDRRVSGDEDGLAPDRNLSRRLLALALACALPLILLAVWARLLPVQPWELALLNALALPGGPYGDLVRVVNTLGDLPVWAGLLGLAAVAVGYLHGRWAALLVALSVAADLAAFGVKLLVERARPETLATEHFFGPDSFAFPSGHVVRAVALAAVLGWVFVRPSWRLPAALAGGLLAGLLMGYARVALGVHWPTDAMGGLLLGLAWFAVTAWSVEGFRQAQRAQR